MPLYEYECLQCHRRTEKIQKFSDTEITVCPFCGGVLERTLTAPNVQFKGGGWYKDLYSSARPPAAGGDGNGTAASTDSSGSAAAKSDGATPAAATAPAATSTPAPASAPAAKPGGAGS
jgi:putative FmdB family regulatory protein